MLGDADVGESDGGCHGDDEGWQPLVAERDELEIGMIRETVKS